MTTTTRYRRMAIEGPNSGVWTEFTKDEFDALYAARPGGVAGNWDGLLSRRDTLVEVFRNGDWRPASYHAIPAWERAAQLEIGRLRQEAASYVVKPSMRLESARQAASAARADLEAATSALKATENALKDTGADVKRAEAQAAAVRSRIDAAEAELERRQAAEDRRAPAPA